MPHNFKAKDRVVKVKAFPDKAVPEGTKGTIKATGETRLLVQWDNGPQYGYWAGDSVWPLEAIALLEPAKAKVAASHHSCKVCHAPANEYQEPGPFTCGQCHMFTSVFGSTCKKRTSVRPSKVSRV